MIASLCSPISARSETKRSRSKFIFAPEAIPIIFSFDSLFFSMYCFIPAKASAPAGSRTVRVSSNISFIAAQIASLSTTTISSTSCLHNSKLCSPTCLTAAPSANKATCFKLTLLFAFRDLVIASAPLASTPMTFIFGLTDLM